ncbi:lipopolysaccharide heptosyltransferase II, partial [Oleiphilus sp. HI0066]|uniref:lipopolysaccharide heptosyltransferase II n=7 Tax=Oleiphilus TaxID=141450 RepID=UPI0008385BE8
YAEIARRHIAEGGQVWLFGSQNDVPACGAIADSIDQDCVSLLAGNTSLEEAVALMSQADLALANDSGLMHVAAALNVPTLGLFGSTSPDYTPPLSEKSAVIKASIDCSPCFKRDCPFGHYKCLEEMMPDRVWTALQGLK